MCSYHTLLVHQLLKCSKYLGPKVPKIYHIGHRSLSTIHTATKSDRAASCLKHCGPTLSRQSWSHAGYNKYTFMSLRSAAYSSSFVSNSNPDTDSDLNDRKRRPKKDMTYSIRSDILNNRQLFQDIMTEKGNAALTDAEWLEVSERLSVGVKGPWEVLAMQALYTENNIVAGRSLMEYLQKQPAKPSMVVQTFFIALLGETSKSEEQDNETLRNYKMLLSQTDVLDAVSIEKLISGLSMTRHYHKCLKLLMMQQETTNACTHSLICVLRAGLRNKDSDIVSFVLKELEQKVETSNLPVFLPKVIDDCLDVGNDEGLEIVMKFVEKLRLLMPRTVLEKFAESFNRYQPDEWSANYSYIHQKHGHCVSCGQQMARSTVSDEEFESIKAVFLDQVIVGTNVFFKTSPEEVKAFIQFVKKTGPYDVVIDGLNVLYNKGTLTGFGHLEVMIRYFSSQGMKVLVVGSRGLLSNLPILQSMNPQPAVYLARTTKADDAFFLYAALHSGKHTLVVSRDKLRDHRFLLKPCLRYIFNQWLLTVQVYKWFISQKKEFIMGRRHLYNIGPVRDDGGWHIPENDMDIENPFGRLSVLCLRNKTGQANRKKVYTKPARSYSTEQEENVHQNRIGNVRQNLDGASSGDFRKHNEASSSDMTTEVSRSYKKQEEAKPRYGELKKKKNNLTDYSRSKPDNVDKARSTEGRKSGVKEQNFKQEKEWFDS